MEHAGVVAYIGADCFGLVVGWVTYRTLRRKEGTTQLSDLATVIAAIGGAAVTKLFDNPNLFGWYCIGLAVGFFLYFIIAVIVTGKDEQATPVSQWMGD
jgi:ABC-type protease/lipase transport system fused ATPase/permease subunit